MSNILRASKFASSAPRSPATHSTPATLTTPISELYIGSSSLSCLRESCHLYFIFPSSPPPLSLVLVLLPLLLAVFWCCVRCICAKQVRNIHIVTYNRAAGRLPSPPTATYPSKKKVPEPGEGATFGENFFSDICLYG